MKVTNTELKGMQEKGYGVTRWANPQEIRDSLKELTEKNIFSIPKDVYENDIVKGYYEKKCAKSKAITAEAKGFIPGGVQHN